MTSEPICAHEDFERGGEFKVVPKLAQLKIYMITNDPFREGIVCHLGELAK